MIIVKRAVGSSPSRLRRAVKSPIEINGVVGFEAVIGVSRCELVSNGGARKGAWEPQERR